MYRTYDISDAQKTFQGVFRETYSPTQQVLFVCVSRIYYVDDSLANFFFLQTIRLCCLRDFLFAFVKASVFIFSFVASYLAVYLCHVRENSLSMLFSSGTTVLFS